MGGGCAVLTLPGGPAVPLEPFRSPLEHLVEHVPVAVLRAHASRFGGHPARIAPRLTGRVDIPATVVSDDATERHLAVRGRGRCVQAASRDQPCGDDLQRAEPTALHPLRHLGRAVDAPVLWVLTARDTDERRSIVLRTVAADLERRPSRRMLLFGFDNEDWPT